MILNTYIILLTKTYMCDIYINKKVLFNKKKYLNILMLIWIIIKSILI